jgi:hypothetical protein
MQVVPAWYNNATCVVEGATLHQEREGTIEELLYLPLSQTLLLDKPKQYSSSTNYPG